MKHITDTKDDSGNYVKMLTIEETRECMKTLDSMETREFLLQKFLPKIVKQARSIYTSNFYGVDDAIQEGKIGLILAIDRFDKTKSAQEFIRYISMYISGWCSHLGYRGRNLQKLVVASIDQPTGNSSESDSTQTLKDVIEDEDTDTFRSAEQKDSFDEAIKYFKTKVKPHEAEIVLKYFLQERTFQQLGDEYNFTSAAIKAMVDRHMLRCKRHLEWQKK